MEKNRTRPGKTEQRRIMLDKAEKERTRKNKRKEEEKGRKRLSTVNKVEEGRKT